MKRSAPYNIYMIFAQRPGAREVASEREWEKRGFRVAQDAIPILILKPHGPIAQVYEAMDVLPKIKVDPDCDPFGAYGSFDVSRYAKLIDLLAFDKKRNLRVEVVAEDYGSELGGSIAMSGVLGTKVDGELLGISDLDAIERVGFLPAWRIKVNRRHTEAQKFATLVHELGHLFCGHLGAFDEGNPRANEYGWPNRQHLPYATMEIEAELVAWHICDREGLTTGAPLYLKGYMEGDPEATEQVDLDRVIRAIAKVYGYLGPAPESSKQRPAHSVTSAPAPSSEDARVEAIVVDQKRDRGIKLAILLGLPVGMMLFGLLLSPVTWTIAFIWDWIWNDPVIAVSRIEQSAMKGGSPIESAVGGLVYGLALDAFFLIAWRLDR